MAVTVGSHSLKTFTQPVNNGTGVVDANEVRTNDNIMRTTYNTHDADSSIHVQSGTLAQRPTAPSEGSMYVGTDTGYIYFYTGGTWLTFISSRVFGAFQDTTTQSVSAVNTPTVMTFNTTDIPDGVTMVSSSRMTVSYTGVYNLQWSGQFVNTDSQIQDVDIWLRVNGTDIVGSNGRVSIPNKHGAVNGALLPSWNYFLSMNANDYVQLVWASTSTAVTLATLPADTGVPHPSTASVIATMSRV